MLDLFLLVKLQIARQKWRGVCGNCGIPQWQCCLTFCVARYMSERVSETECVGICFECSSTYSYPASRVQDKNQNLKISNKAFENVAEFRHLRTALANQDCLLEEMKSVSNAVKACFCMGQVPLSSCLLSKETIIMISTQYFRGLRWRSG